jgi:hypothetical protein
MEVPLNAFLTSVLDGGDWLASLSERIYQQHIGQEDGWGPHMKQFVRRIGILRIMGFQHGPRPP